jgi:hypothetical protein
MTRRDAKKRVSARAALDHPWLRGEAALDLGGEVDDFMAQRGGGCALRRLMASGGRRLHPERHRSLFELAQMRSEGFLREMLETAAHDAGE